MIDEPKEKDSTSATGNHVKNVNATAHPGVESGLAATENTSRPAGENLRGGVGVSSSAPPSRVAIYSHDDSENPKKNSTASGGKEIADAMAAEISVDEIIRRLWESDGTVTREQAMMAAAARLHDASRCFAMSGLKKAARLLKDQADFAFRQARASRMAREMAAANKRLSGEVAR